MRNNLAKVKFLAEANSELQRTIRVRIEHVISEVLAHFGGVVSIVLIGSLGRGEGIWKLDDGSAKLTSDLDLLIVTSNSQSLPEPLRHLSYERGAQIPVNISLATHRNLNRRRKGTYAMDIKEGSLVIWGDDVIEHLPEVRPEDIGFEDIVALFFNRGLFSIVDFSPGDLVSTDKTVLIRLSHEASKMVSTCADMISITANTYTPSTLTRLKITKEMVEKGTIAIDIDQQGFLALLDLTIEFNIDKKRPYIENIQHYWLSARLYLMDIFSMLLSKEHPGAHLPDALHLLSEYSRPSVKLRVYTWYRLLRLGKIPSLLPHVDPVVSWKKAVLTAFMAITADELLEEHVHEAERSLGKIYWRRDTGGSVNARWIRLRDELRMLRLEYVFI